MDKKSQKVKVGITMGDMNGIGLEVILKVLSDERILNHCIPVIYGSAKIVSYHKNIINQKELNFKSQQSAERLSFNNINVINCWQETATIQLGKPTEESGKFAYIALDRAINDQKKGLIDVLVTGPINKMAMQLANFPFNGHTDYLQSEYGAPECLMMMIHQNFRVGLATSHIPLSHVTDHIEPEFIKSKTILFLKSLQEDFGILKPSIAVLGLNPHASDDGLMGSEENEMIRPMIIEMKKSGHLVVGPYPADSFFGTMKFRQVDGVMAMYHDQGLIPFKTLVFNEGINYTAGLPVVRTSPDHGTAMDIAGTNQADPTSMRNAIYEAIDICRNRADYSMERENTLKKKTKATRRK